MNRKYILAIGSIIILLLMLIFPMSILGSPNISPFEYLQSKPYIEIGSIIILVPSSTVIVYLLGVITIFIGVKLSKLKEIHQKYWGIALILWGIGTILAGTSYQGLGYELKCANQELCLFTSWFELSYLYVTALSITIMAYAVSIKSLDIKYLKIYNKITSIGFVVYSLSLLTGVIFEVKLLVTYEWFLVFFLIYFVSFMVINVSKNRSQQNRLDKGLMNVWISMLVINILYFVYYYSGIGEFLYNNYNMWFSANDVLHVGLIPWMYYIYRVVKQ